MFIEQVIEACDRFYPNPYTLEEKYFWCDELSELLTVRYKPQYVKSELFEEDGKYLLPEGVSASMIDTIICGDRILKKQDFREFGILCFDTPYGCELKMVGSGRYNRVYAIYIMPYEKIRNIDEELLVTFGSDYFLTDHNLFRNGDVFTVTKDDVVYEDVFVLDTCIDEETSKIKVIVSEKNFPQGTGTAKFTRRVMEETVCPPPYDSMYIDYLLGKMCYYQNDFVACNNHMSIYNAKLADYEKWLKSHPVVDYIQRKFENWW